MMLLADQGTGTQTWKLLSIDKRQVMPGEVLTKR